MEDDLLLRLISLAGSRSASLTIVTSFADGVEATLDALERDRGRAAGAGSTLDLDAWVAQARTRLADVRRRPL